MPPISRRSMLNQSAAAGAALAIPAVTGAAPDTSAARISIVDSNVSLFQWPFRRLPFDTTQQLVQKLTSLGISEAWAGSFEGLLHRDLSAVNQRLCDECQKHPVLLPVGTVNPTLAGWEDDLHRCRNSHQMHAIRLYPGYHSYTLDDARFVACMVLANKLGLLVQLAATMEDTRTQAEQLRVPDVNLKPLQRLLTNGDGPPVQTLNLRPAGSLVQELAELPGLYFDTARVDGTDGVPRLEKSVPSGRVLFGSHAPFLIPEAALIRTHEAGQLSNSELQQVLSGNAVHLRRKVTS